MESGEGRKNQKQKFHAGGAKQKAEIHGEWVEWVSEKGEEEDLRLTAGLPTGRGGWPLGLSLRKSPGSKYLCVRGSA